MGSIYKKKTKEIRKSKQNYRFTNDNLKSDTKSYLNFIRNLLRKIIAILMIVLPFSYFNFASNYIISIGENIGSNSFAELFNLIVMATLAIIWYSIALFMLFSKRFK